MLSLCNKAVMIINLGNHGQSINTILTILEDIKLLFKLLVHL